MKKTTVEIILKIATLLTELAIGALKLLGMLKTFTMQCVKPKKT